VGTNLQGSKVMCSNSYERALPAKVLVQLVLQIDETTVPCSVKVDPPQDSCYCKGTDQGCFGLDCKLQGLLACMQAQLFLHSRHTLMPCVAAGKACFPDTISVHRQYTAAC